ncbi:hypothetical protein JL09_g6742, partial [Pichia kudriavzevii]
LRWSESDVDAM